MRFASCCSSVGYRNCGPSLSLSQSRVKLTAEHRGGVFVKDMQTDDVLRIGQDGGGMPLTISADGRYVAYAAFSFAVHRYDTKLHPDVLVATHATYPQMSADGRYVA